MSTNNNVGKRPSRLRLGYGSEWHLLRYLGRHRSKLSDLVRHETGATAVDWLDFGLAEATDAEHGYGDKELTGVEFLPKHSPIREEWRKYWPQTGNVQNWDAIASLTCENHREWLLVEAKANVEELRSATGAREHGGLPRIRAALDETKKAMGVDAACDWTKPYYQYANRLAFLHFLTMHRVDAQLCFIYFVGDQAPMRTCPEDVSTWKVAIDAAKEHLGLTSVSAIESRVHELFVPITGLAVMEVVSHE